MADRIKQFPLKFKPKVDFSRADFMANRCNEKALRAVELWPEWPFFALVVYGPQGSGKSHLAHVFAEHAASCTERPFPVLIINAQEINNKNVARIHRENPCLVVENLTPRANNEALFHLFNLYQNEGGYILFTAEDAPARMRFKLPDLQSRLNMVPTIAIEEPDDEMLTMLVVKMFNDRQIMISPVVLNYIIRNMQRSFSYARRLVEEVDMISLARKRAVTVPLVKEAMQTLDTHVQQELF